MTILGLSKSECKRLPTFHMGGRDFSFGCGEFSLNLKISQPSEQVPMKVGGKSRASLLSKLQINVRLPQAKWACG